MTNNKNIRKSWNIKVLTIFIASCCFILNINALANPATIIKKGDGEKEREYLVDALIRIADPVMTALSKNELRKTMPVEASEEGREKFTHLEAFGRLLAGMAPWLELGPGSTPEGKLRKKYIALAQLGIHNATDPDAPDFMNFDSGGQALVDVAFFAQALLRAPQQLWDPLSDETKGNVIAALKSSRGINPSYSNWLLFSGMVEAALLQFTGSCDEMRMDYAIKSHRLWYKGDGMYGDGPNFHWDYYNSYVIQPMLLEILDTRVNYGYKSRRIEAEYDLALKRAQRYAEVQERLISPEATYPAIGRSLTYRFGAFQLLSKIALMKALPEDIQPQQVRYALYSVIKKQLEVPGTFDKDGWLTIGFYGHQPGMGERYISTGSLYLCSEAFLMLGLSADDPFWMGDDVDWTAKKIWSGQEVPVDHAIYD